MFTQNEMKLNAMLAVYQAANHNMEFCKKQQWQILYWIITLHSGFAAFYSIQGSSEIPKLGNVFLFLGVMVAVFGAFMIGLLQCSIINEKGTVKNIEKVIPFFKLIVKPSIGENEIKEMEIEPIFCWERMGNKKENGNCKKTCCLKSFIKPSNGFCIFLGIIAGIFFSSITLFYIICDFKIPFF